MRFFGSSAGTGVTGLRIYRAGHEAAGPIVNDEIYDYAVEMDGKNWKHFMVDLVPGDYILRLSHVTRLWHAGKAPAGYADRSIDLLYFTDEIWEDAPSDATLQTLRDAGAPADLQMSAQPALDARGEERRRLWQVRPLSWEDSQTQPRLFALSREYWRQQIDALGNKDYGTEVPDYRVPERQIVFDDDWNLVANPVQIRRRIDALNSDILTRPSPHFSYWLQAGDFQKFEAEWARYGTGMIATYGDFNGSASTDFPVDQPGEYTVWAHFRLLNAYYAPWRVTATNPAGEKLSWDHDAKEYPSEWQKIGVLKMDRVGIVHFEIDPLGFQNPGTYRIIYDFLLTTDADYVPQGDVRPPLNLSQYNARAHASGATGKDAYLIWIFDNAYTPLVQEVGSDNSWPLPTVQALVVKEPIVPSITRKLVMPSCTQRAVQIGLRSLRDKPIKLHVGCGDLKGAEGDFPGKVSWRVVGFVPQNESTRDFHDQAVDVVHDARLVGQEPRLAQPDL
ncbi:MAG TPA: hypothetical protein PLY87_09185 [Planctomycetaceae bacterium]|nr:hypothetical protein [Planctomycetaceae bacterium]